MNNILCYALVTFSVLLQNKLVATDLKTQKYDLSLKDKRKILVIDKSTFSAQLQEWPSSFKSKIKPTTFVKFDIAIGSSIGDKTKTGDLKTPEGIYFTRSLLTGRSLPKRYGALALPISYPNKFDKSEHKTGYGIWLHGVDNSDRIKKRRVTKGCVAFYNDDIKYLGDVLQSDYDAIIIAKNLQKINKSTDIIKINSLTNEWYSSWKTKKIDNYISFYSDDFKSNGKNKKVYKKYKKSIFNYYKKMDVNIFETKVITHDKYAISVFNQDFYGNSNYSSKGRKTLFWQKNNSGEWKIIHEVFEEKRFRLKQAKLVYKAPKTTIN